jgi:hypothetical protein
MNKSQRQSYVSSRKLGGTKIGPIAYGPGLFACISVVYNLLSTLGEDLKIHTELVC